MASTPAVVSGAMARASATSLAGGVRTRSASPRRMAWTIWRAARSASIESSGKASLMLNQAYSARCRPLKVAWRGLPVRIRPGQIVVTDLYSEEAPFIRYATGDVGVASSRICPCGRALPLLEHIEGRSNDLIMAPDGRLINSLALIYPLREIAGIEQYRIVQKHRDCFHVQIACSADYRQESEQRIRAAWDTLLRVGVRVTFEYVPRVAPDPRGKFRHVVSEVPSSEPAVPPALSA